MFGLGEYDSFVSCETRSGFGLSQGKKKMGMVTELQLQEQVVIGGERIAVHKWQLNNQHLQQVCAVISRLQMAILEMDSNNSTGQMIGTDAEAINQDWARAKLEWDIAKKYRNLAPAAQEKLLAVLAITDNEQLRTVNVKCRRVITALSTLMQKILFSDSAKLQYGLGDRDIKRFEEHMLYVEELLKTYIGDGTESNTGISIPAHEHLGVVVPPINMHEAQVSEPSPGFRGTPGQDAADTPSTIPPSGANTPVK
jgi:hypothetical protein